jgi:hypothetical protein
MYIVWAENEMKCVARGYTSDSLQYTLQSDQLQLSVLPKDWHLSWYNIHSKHSSQSSMQDFINVNTVFVTGYSKTWRNATKMKIGVLSYSLYHAIYLKMRYGLLW